MIDFKIADDILPLGAAAVSKAVMESYNAALKALHAATESKFESSMGSFKDIIGKDEMRR